MHTSMVAGHIIIIITKTLHHYRSIIITMDGCWLNLILSTLYFTLESFYSNTLRLFRCIYAAKYI